MEKLSWSALEYDDKERGSDWFWALGVIVITGSAAAIIFGNYFFAGLLVLSGIMLGFYAKRKPEMVQYELNEKGLKVDNRIFPYENLRSFYVQLEDPHHPNPTGDNPKIKPLLFVRSERAFMPIIAVPIEDYMTDEIHNIMTSQNVPEEMMKEHVSEKVMEILGF